MLEVKKSERASREELHKEIDGLKDEVGALTSRVVGGEKEMTGKDERIHQQKVAMRKFEQRVSKLNKERDELLRKCKPSIKVQRTI